MQVPINLFVFYAVFVTLNSVHVNRASDSVFVKFLTCCNNCHCIMQCNGLFESGVCLFFICTICSCWLWHWSSEGGNPLCLVSRYFTALESGLIILL